MADQFCDVEQEDFIQLECGSELGGVIAIGLILPSVDVGANDAAIVSNLENDDWWLSHMDSSPSSAFIIKDTRGSKAAGTPTEEEGYGLTSTQRTGDDHELVFEAQGVMKNRKAIAGLNKRTDLGFVYITAGKDSSGGYEAFYVPNTSFYASDLIEQSIKTKKRWSGSVKWSTDLTPSLPFIAPASIFTN